MGAARNLSTLPLADRQRAQFAFFASELCNSSKMIVKNHYRLMLHFAAPGADRFQTIQVWLCRITGLCCLSTGRTGRIFLQEFSIGI
ncbi:MAG: hypothetical protein H6961_01435 [Chromatiaceae bacterium]|nr:hypothetical protein [Chromatiaceae bacterium]HPE81695.1 hypothetical protein [Gammaproteobacteria bacterium]